MVRLLSYTPPRYVEQIDLGTETRTVVSGLVKYVPIEEMQDKMVVAIVGNEIGFGVLSNIT